MKNKDIDIKIDNENSKHTFNFIDLCCGIGGFHTALNNIKELQSKCILASDIDLNCRKTYFMNYNMVVHNDLTKIPKEKLKDVRIDMVCAGFPCQPFSVAGKRMGLDDTRGTLIYDIFNLIEFLNPKFVVLENVKGLKSMVNKKDNTEKKIYEWILLKLKTLGYLYFDKILSPHEIGIPQKRDRVIIVGVRADLVSSELHNDFQNIQLNNIKNLIDERKLKNTQENKILQENKEIDDEYKFTDKEKNIIDVWKKFVSMKEWDLISNFELNRIYSDTLKFKKQTDRNFKQSHIFIDFLLYKNNKKIPPNVPYYKTRKCGEISQSVYDNCKMLNIFYDNYEPFKNLIDKFFIENRDNIEKMSYMGRMLEYSGGMDYGSSCDLNKCFGQFRQSGTRIRKGYVFPTLVKSGPIPFIIKENRFLTNIECARLQSFDDDFIFLSRNECIKQTGNAVNTQVIELMIRSVINYI
jgi:DNA (cytosine-5)-methyltransferase 1